MKTKNKKRPGFDWLYNGIYLTNRASACSLCGEIMMAGKTLISPIIYWHEMEDYVHCDCLDELKFKESFSCASFSKCFQGTPGFRCFVCSSAIYEGSFKARNGKMYNFRFQPNGGAITMLRKDGTPYKRQIKNREHPFHEGFMDWHVKVFSRIRKKTERALAFDKHRKNKKE